MVKKTEFKVCTLLQAFVEMHINVAAPQSVLGPPRYSQLDEIQPPPSYNDALRLHNNKAVETLNVEGLLMQT